MTVFLGVNGSGKTSISRALAALPFGVERGLGRFIDSGGGHSRFFRSYRAKESSLLEIELGCEIIDKAGAKLSTMNHRVSLGLDESKNEHLVVEEIINIFNNKGSKTNSVLDFHSKLGSSRKQGEYSFESSDTSLKNLLDMWVRTRRSKGSEFLGQDLPSSYITPLKLIPEIKATYFLKSIRIDATNPAVLRGEWMTMGWLADEARNLRSFIASIGKTSTTQCRPCGHDKITHKTRWLEEIQKFAPWIKDISVVTDVMGNSQIMVSEGPNSQFSPLDLSDGTLMLIGRLGILESHPRVLVIDEPEVHLHPDAIETLMKTYRERLGTGPGQVQQIIIFTQSPHIVKYCDPHELRIVERHGDESVIMEASSDLDLLREQLRRSGMRLDEAWLGNFFGATALARREKISS